MKLKFKNQDFQTNAVNAVVDLFSGQEKTHSTFSVEVGAQLNLYGDPEAENLLRLDGQALAKNMHTVQRKNLLPQTEADWLKGEKTPQFCIEMETGTGKTYVYTKTIFELHKRYGFTKFIIVVPSVAIREGVYKSLEITREHFAALYDNIPCRFFIYQSGKLSDVRNFTNGRHEYRDHDHQYRCL